MSEPVSKRRPMVDLGEFERRLRQPRAANQWDSEPFAELAQMLGRQEDSRKTRELTGQGSIKVQPDAEAPCARKEPPPLERFITGDFAAIEAGLLGSRRQAPALLTQSPEWPIDRKEPPAPARLVSDDFAAIEAELFGARREPAAPRRSVSDDFTAIETAMVGARGQKVEAQLIEADPAEVIGAKSEHLSDHSADEAWTVVSRHVRIADDEVRSRLPLYAMAAILIAGLACVGASFGSGSGESKLSEIATFDAANETAAVQAGSLSSSDANVNEASGVSSSQEASTAPLGDDAGQPVDPTRSQKRAPRVILLGDRAQSGARLGAEEASAAPPATQALAQADQPGHAAAAEPAQVRTALVGPDGALLSNDAAPQATGTAAPPQAAPLPAPVAKAQTPKASRHVATAAKPAGAVETGGRNRAAQVTPPAKPKLGAGAAKLAPTKAADAAPAAPPPPAPPAAATNNGALGFVQTAVNSIATGAEKLWDWSRTEMGARP